MIVELRSEQAAFLEENLKLMEKFEGINWEYLLKAEDTAKNFQDTIDTFLDQF